MVKPTVWPGELTDSQRRVLEYMVKIGMISADTVGEVADENSEPKIDRKYRTSVNKYGISFTRIGWAILVWLHKWGFVQYIELDGYVFWQITTQGKQALHLVRGE